MTLTVSMTIPVQRIADLLCGAFEGGSTYWIEAVEPRFASHCDYSDGANIHPDMPKRKVLADGDYYEFSYETIQRGLSIFHNYPSHLADFLSENDDAETSDVFLQLCLFGDIIYG